MFFVDAVIIASVVHIAHEGHIAMGMIIAAALIVPITVYMFNIKYIISGSSLIVKDSIFSHVYDINDIRSIKPLTHYCLHQQHQSTDSKLISPTTR